jgi:hypothetical protein
LNTGSIWCGTSTRNACGRAGIWIEAGIIGTPSAQQSRRPRERPGCLATPYGGGCRRVVRRCPYGGESATHHR